MSTSTENFLITAHGWVATPFRYNTFIKGVGCDCVGLLAGIMKDMKIFPNLVADFKQYTAKEVDLQKIFDNNFKKIQKIELGSVLLFRQGSSIWHVAIVSSMNQNGQTYLLHASQKLKKVSISQLTNDLHKRLIGIYIIP